MNFDRMLDTVLDLVKQKMQLNSLMAEKKDENEKKALAIRSSEVSDKLTMHQDQMKQMGKERELKMALAKEAGRQNWNLKALENEGILKGKEIDAMVKKGEIAATREGNLLKFIDETGKKTTSGGGEADAGKVTTTESSVPEEARRRARVMAGLEDDTNPQGAAKAAGTATAAPQKRRLSDSEKAQMAKDLEFIDRKYGADGASHVQAITQGVDTRDLMQVQKQYNKLERSRGVMTKLWDKIPAIVAGPVAWGVSAYKKQKGLNEIYDRNESAQSAWEKANPVTTPAPAPIATPQVQQTAPTKVQPIQQPVINTESIMQRPTNMPAYPEAAGDRNEGGTISVGKGPAMQVSPEGDIINAAMRKEKRKRTEINY